MISGSGRQEGKLGSKRRGAGAKGREQATVGERLGEKDGSKREARCERGRVGGCSGAVTSPA